MSRREKLEQAVSTLPILLTLKTPLQVGREYGSLSHLSTRQTKYKQALYHGWLSLLFNHGRAEERENEINEKVRQ
uniref:Uncharacterized protein n=1 Tax=Rhizophora mucronata TaxID=61149 RepID=A0A2P2Q4J6_RHIMU